MKLRTILFVAILALGIFARTWEFSSLPPGLNQDEAASAVDAYSLLHFGTGRNGESWPVHFISWGSGQNAPYVYLLLPFIAVGGLTPLTVRLPMLITGILSLPLFYWVSKRIGDEIFALLSMFFLAISPWHILLSRWGLETNILPFIFLVGFACLLASTQTNHWFITAAFFFGLSLYAYGTAYVAASLITGIAAWILYRAKRLHPRTLLAGLLVFGLTALPIAGFVLINLLKLDTLVIGPFTIPRLPVQPRMQMIAAFFRPEFFRTLVTNGVDFFKFLAGTPDPRPFNAVSPYGYFYPWTFLLAACGVGLFAAGRSDYRKPERTLLLTWLGICLIIGVLQPVNTNRNNLIFFPLLLCTAAAVVWLSKRHKAILVAAVIGFLCMFAFFTRDYHGSSYRAQAGEFFFDGLLPAIEAASTTTSPDQPVCITSSVNMPYIFVLFVEQMDPGDYLETITYEDPNAPFRRVTNLDRYTFGLENCVPHANSAYLLRDEIPPITNIEYTVTVFGNYILYLP